MRESHSLATLGARWSISLHSATRSTSRRGCNNLAAGGELLVVESGRRADGSDAAAAAEPARTRPADRRLRPRPIAASLNNCTKGGVDLTSAADVTAAERAVAQMTPAARPESHPETLFKRAQLARHRAEAGDLPGAIRDYEDLLPDLVRVLGRDSAGTLDIGTAVSAKAGDRHSHDRGLRATGAGTAGPPQRDLRTTALAAWACRPDAWARRERAQNVTMGGQSLNRRSVSG